MNNLDTQEVEDITYIVYDGECPFCSSYVGLVRLKESVGHVDLYNAREGGKQVEGVIARGYDLDDGMVLKYKDQYYHGADCLHMIALLSKPSTMFNRFNIAMARSSRLAHILYPLLRAGRNTTLRLLGRRKIHTR